MKMYFVNPSEKNILNNAGDRMPLGLLSVATSAKNAGHDVTVFDLNHTSEQRFVTDVQNEQPDLIGYTIISSPLYYDVVKLINTTKKRSLSSKQVVGGYHCIARPQDFHMADEIVVGDGEQAILDIANGKKMRKEIQRVDINKIIYPDRNLLDTNNYQMLQNDKRCATIISSRGCPFSCVFCGNYDRKVRFRNPENVRKEIKQLVDLGFESLYFLDDAFTVNKKHAKSITDVVKEFDLPFRITTRANLLSDDLVKYMSKRGLEIVSIGIESGDNQILKNVNKQMTTEDNERAVEICNKYGVDVKGFFMFGMPGEGPKEAEKTITFAKKLKRKGLTSADFYAMTPFPGTPIYKNPEMFGCKILTHDWSKYLEAGKEEIEPVMETDKLSAKQIKYYMKKAREEFDNV